MKLMHLVIAALTAVLGAPALAQGAPAWTGEGTIGAGVTTGNTKTTDIAGGVKLKRTGDIWSQSGEISGEYGENGSVETRNRIAAAFQVDRSFNDRLRAFGRAGYEKDEFSGFENRYFAGVGLGYDMIQSEPTVWTLQGGPAYRVDEIRTTGESEESLAFIGGSRFKHQLNEQVALTNDTDVILADFSNQIINSSALTFTVTGNLQGRISYDVRHDTDPPAGFKETDTATRFSLVYKLS